MKVHYINILLFALPLNILVRYQKIQSITPHHTPSHTPTTRLLCECEFYAPVNYDSDPEMKKVMENFNRQTSQRFHEYDERMKTTRQKCKDKCDKEIQKIILKDKLEKQMEQQLTTLETKITTDDIPTCICEKSMADKVEKGCLRCGYGLGTVAPTVGLIGSVAIDAWKEVATASAIDFATKAGIKAGIAKVIEKIKEISFVENYLKFIDWSNFINASNYKSIPGLVEAAKAAKTSTGKACTADSKEIVCSALSKGETWFTPAVRDGIEVTTTTTESVEKAAMGTIQNTTTTSTTAIIASVVTIIVIVLIMVIIYLILRYRRKKKMKRKLQYIKLLEE
ncbi:rifin PIR protein, putative [Plasmodium reichenowi]|uniref:Rifin PIR protein, putative n=1 Tax=Plasmodium reichenowi TaxID=5854 RepID=A0A2P9DBD9_PLARE|nr:rifin PIR protein, putative [Plasmodium reichenowi]